MKPAFLIGAAVIAVIGVAAIAFAASGSDDDNETAQTSPTPTATREPTSTPRATREPTLTPTETPMPVEPDGGIGTTPDEEPTVGPGTPIPVEPDGGIGNTPGDEPTAGPDTPIPSEPIFTVTPASDQTTLPPGHYAEAAPIDSLDLRIAESFPPQYFLHVVAGLPSGCAQQYTHFFERNGNVVEVHVLNSFPEGNPVCTAIYGQYEVNIALGSDFVSGETYTVSVNDGAAETQFTAQ